MQISKLKNEPALAGIRWDFQSLNRTHRLQSMVVKFAWDHLGKKICWEGEGMDEKGYDVESGNLMVAVDPRYFRPTEVETLLGDPSKAKEKLGWVPKITLEEMVHEMMEHDLTLAKRDALVKEHGYRAFDYHE